MTGLGKGTERMKKLVVVQPLCELQGSGRMENILADILGKFENEGVVIESIVKASELESIDMRNRHVLFAISLTEAGVNIEYYRMLEYFRSSPDCLEGSVGGIIVDGQSELFTKALARRLAFSANAAGCTFPGKPLVEATGDLGNFHVLSGVRGVEPMTVYVQQVESLVRKVIESYPRNSSSEQKDLNILAVHASSRKTSNTLLLWDKVRKKLEDTAEIREISLRDGAIQECIGCRYEDCLHYGEQGRCFYGGIITEQVYPAILSCDVLVMICPNYNDALNANFTAFINRLTALFRVHDFSKKRVYAIVVSGYSGGDLVSEQIIGALNFNKGFILPGRFAMVETANDPFSILEVPDIDKKAGAFAEGILNHRSDRLQKLS